MARKFVRRGIGTKKGISNNPARIEDLTIQHPPIAHSISYRIGP